MTYPDFGKLSGTKFVIGSAHLAALALNVLSFVFLPKLSRILTSEVMILVGTLATVSGLGNFLIVSKVYKLIGDPEQAKFVGLMCLYVPIIYNLFLPAILAKSSTHLGGRSKASVCVCDVLFTLVWVSCLLHIVLLLSPMPAFDYHKFQSVHTAAEASISHDASRPQLLLIGTIPQGLSAILSFNILREIAQYRRQAGREKRERKKQMCAVGEMGSESPQGGKGKSGGGKGYLADYVWRWGCCSLLLVLPSMLVSQWGFIAYQRGTNIPVFFTYTQTICDTLIFMTQPFWLLVTWLSVDVKKLESSSRELATSAENQQLLLPSGGLNNFSTSHNGPDIQSILPLSPSQTDELQKLAAATPIQSQV